MAVGGVHIPKWVLGRNTLAVITFLTVDANGILTLAEGGFSLAGKLDEVDFDSEVQHEEISAMDVRKAHNVIILDDSTLTMTEILSVNQANMLPYFAANYDYAHVMFARGPQTWDEYFVRGNYSESSRKGRNVGRMQVKQVNIVERGNPLYYNTGDPVYGTLTLLELLAA